MMPPVFTLATASADVLTLLGENPTRVYPFGRTPDKSPLPYATWQIVDGLPTNYLGNRPDADQVTIQMDVWATQAAEADAAAIALRDALEVGGYVVNWRGTDRDAETNVYHVGFDMDFITSR